MIYFNYEYNRFNSNYTISINSSNARNNNRSLLALHKEFTQYQVDESRVKEKDVAIMELSHDNIAKSIQKNEQMIGAVNKRIPDEVKKCIKHIELSR